MDAGEVNKIAGAILGTLTLAMGVGFFASLLVSPKPLQKAGWELPEAASASAPGAPAAAAAPAEPIAKRLAAATLAKGESLARSRCASCHQFAKDGRNTTGPALYGVVARNKGASAGFNYSNPMKDRAAKGEKWDFEQLDGFIANPRAYMPGTTMAFAGVARPDERADIILYLRSLADSPAPLPQ